MQTTLQRRPRNSVEQFGQIDAASFFGFAGTFAAVSIAIGELVERDAIPEAFEFELMFGVVAQIRLPENTNEADTNANQDASPSSSGQIHSGDSTVKWPGAVPKW
ncbi:MAG TPA: hypothetical protein VJW96_11255 [Terriglobales bacterium]|nr:hypothetical protein [Terriglobales bacterium]